MPTGREEEWRFTPIRHIAGVLADAPVDHTPQWTLEALPAGASVAEISRDEARKRSVRAPSDRAGANAATQALRTLLFSIAPGKVIERPIEIGLGLEGYPLRTHFLMEVGEGAEVTLVARYTGTAEISEFLSFDLAARAHLNLVLIDETSTETVFLTDLAARLGRDAKLKCSIVGLGAAVARRNTTVVLNGEGAEVDLYGLYFANDGQHIENRVFVDHVAPRCRSRVAYKGALAGETARTVWIGDVLIRAEAEGTDTYELNRNLLLTGRGARGLRAEPRDRDRRDRGRGARVRDRAVRRRADVLPAVAGHPRGRGAQDGRARVLRRHRPRDRRRPRRAGPHARHRPRTGGRP